MEELEEEYNPYCKICDACGENSCCAGYHCDNHIEGKYCGTYFFDFKFGYMMYKDIMKYLDNKLNKDDEIFKDIENLWDDNYEFVYNNNK